VKGAKEEKKEGKETEKEEKKNKIEIGANYNSKKNETKIVTGTP